MCAYWGVALAALIALVYGIGGQLFIDALTTAEDVRTTAGTYLLWTVIAPFACLGAFLFDGIFIGTTHIREMRNAMVLSAAIWGLVLYLALPVFGYHGLWLAMTSFMVVRSVLLGGYYPRVEAACNPR